MNIIDQYDILANRIIEQDEEITAYEKDLKDKKIKITSMMREVKILLHPVKLVRLSKERKRLVRISSELEELKRTTVLNNMDEESGDLEEDLSNSAYKYKPGRIKLFMKRNQI